MSLLVVRCAGCGRKARDCTVLIQFTEDGESVHVCDECIDLAKEIVDDARLSRGKPEAGDPDDVR